MQEPPVVLVVGDDQRESESGSISLPITAGAFMTTTLTLAFLLTVV
jgi:hypothetical protein